MIVGFDAKRAIQNNTGLGNYSRYLVEILSEHEPDNHYLLFAPKDKPNVRLQILHSRPNVAFVFPRGLCRLFAWLWRIAGIKRDIRKQGVDVYHGLSNELPAGIISSRRSNVRTVVTIHDLIFLRYPRYYKPIDRIIYRIKFRTACRHAGRIIAVSECTKRDIVRFFRIPEDKITVVYQGCHPAFAQEVGEEKRQAVAAHYHLPSRFVLSVGTIEERKNLVLAVRALAHIPDDIHLVAVGRHTAYARKVEQYAARAGVAHRLHLLHDVSFEDLPAVYRLATVCVYPSLFEGFGIPVVEALASGVPVVAATGSCLEEAGGPDSLYADPTNETELAQHILTVLNDPEKAAKMISAGREYVRRFSGQHIAGEVMRVYESLITFEA
ncbi:MAG: glycosyltransferase family 4 protein [Tannerellaceae bacterium]|jgi:glycosyltransferase involved in cell wall biosynthesis|nr:glycosyltransferase family 4 protein [Tannerellaceae bacterium]